MANILEDVQNFVVGKLSSDAQLSGNCEFIAENRKDIDYQIKNALGRQGIVAVCMTPKATYAGKYEDLFLAWTLEELEIDVVENVTVNRGAKNGKYMTGQDVAMRVFDVLCPLSGGNEGQFNPVSYEEGEDGNLLVNKCVLKALVYGEHGDTPQPEPGIQFQFVKLLAEPPTGQPHDGWMWREGTGFKICQGETVYDLGVAYDVMSAYVESRVSSKAEISDVQDVSADLADLSNSLSGYYVKSETSSAAELDAEFAVKADLSTLNEVADSLSDYYVKSETSSSAEIQTALDGKQPTGDYALVSQLPTKTSELSNDSGYITSAQVIPSQINVGNASTSDKSLVSQALAEDVADEHSTRVIVDEYDNVILQKYTTGWYVSKIEEGTGSPTVYTETDAYYVIVSDIRIESSEGRLYFTVDGQDKQRNLVSKYRQSFTPNYSADEFIADAIYWTASEAGHSIIIRLTVKNAQTPVWVNIARLVPDSSKYSGLLDTQITPNGQFVTPTQVKPYNSIRGYASRAYGSLFMFGRSDIQTPDENHYVTIDYRVGKLCYAGQTYYPWYLSMYNGTTFDPPLEMTYGYRGNVGYKLNGRVRNLVVNSNCWLAMHTVNSRNTMPYYIKAVEDEYGQMIPDNNLYITTVAHPITFSQTNLSIETIDGVAGNITCTRQGTGTYTTEFKYFPFEDELSAKADLSALNLKQDRLTDEQMANVNTKCLPLNLSGNTAVSGNNYLDFHCLPRFFQPVVMNGALDVKQLNIVNYDVDSYTALSAIDEDTIEFVGGFNREHAAVLNLKNGTIAYVSDIEQAVSSYALKTDVPLSVSQLENDANYIDRQALNQALSSKVSKSGDTVQWIGIGRPEQRLQATGQLGFQFSIDDFGSALVKPKANTDVSLDFPGRDGTLATTDDIQEAISAKADLSALNAVESSLSDYYAKNQTSSATEIQTALNGKQDKLSDAQISAIDTPCLPLNLSGNTAVSGNNYLDFHCLPRFFEPVVMNGALDVQQLNIVNYDVDSYTALSAMDEDTLAFVGGFNREHIAVLNLKSDTIAYVSDISAMYEARISALEARIAALEGN